MGPILSNIELLKAEVRTWHGFSERLEREKQELHYRLQIAEEALKETKEVIRCQHLNLERNLSEMLESRKIGGIIDPTDVYQVKFRLEHLQKELDKALEQIQKE